MSVDVRRLHTSDFILWILISTTLFFWTPAMDVFNFPKQWILVCLTFGLAVHYVLGGNLRKHPIRRNTRILMFLLMGTAITQVFSAVFSEATIARSFYGYPGRANGLLTYFSIMVITWVGARTKFPSDFESKILKSMMFVYSVFSVYALLQYLNLDPVPWSNPYNRIIGTLGNPNFSGAFLGVASSVVLHIAIRSSKRPKYIYGFFALLLFILALLTQSVQALGIFAIGLAIQILMIVYRKTNRRVTLVSFFAFFLLGFIFLISFLGYGPWGQSLYQYTLSLRFTYWRIGLDIARNFPWTGIGPDSYVEGFRLFRGSDFVGKYSQDVIADSAHNVLINFMANFGLVAFLFYFAIVMIISIKAIRILFSGNPLSIAASVLSLSWLLLLIQSLFSLEQIGLNVFQWCCGALLLNPGISPVIEMESDRKKFEIKTERESFFVALRTEFSLLLMVLAMVVSWSLMRQEMSLLKLASLPQGSKLSAADFDKEMSSFSAFTKQEVRRAIYVSDFLLKIDRIGEAQNLLENVVKLDPDGFEALEQLARLAQFSSDPKMELSYRTRIENIDPFNYRNLLRISELQNSLGRFDISTLYAKKVLKISKDQLVNDSATILLSSQTKK